MIGKGVVNVEDDSAGCMTHGSVIRVSDEGDRAVIRDSDEGDRACVDEAGVAATEASVRAQLDDLSLRVTHLADDIERVSGAWARPDLASALANCQGLINTLTAVQDVAITRLAAIEEEWLEDGLVVESRRAPGHIALDAPDVVAGALRVSHLQAQRRVRTAVRLVSEVLDGAGTTTESTGEPESMGDSTETGESGESMDAGAAVVDGAGDDRSSGMSGVHRAMRDGLLDGYSASVLDAELEEAPGEVASAVLAAIEDRFATDAPSALRQRCRRALARISPDLLRRRAQRAREECGLKRWAEAPGVDRWTGSFPSERAAMGWAAVDALARRYVKDGLCERLEQARGQALMDLVTANATIDVTLVFTTAEEPDAGGARVDRPQAPTAPERAGTSPAQAFPRGTDRLDGPSSRVGEHDAREPMRIGERDAASSTPGRPALGAGEPSRSSAATPRAERAGENRDVATVGLGTVVGATDAGLVEAFGPSAGDPLLVSRSWLYALARGEAAVRRGVSDGLCKRGGCQPEGV